MIKVQYRQMVSPRGEGLQGFFLFENGERNPMFDTPIQDKKVAKAVEILHTAAFIDLMGKGL